MTTLLTIAVVFGVLLISASVTVVGKAINEDWPEPGE